MTKIIDRYKELKLQDNKTLYLFLVGNFYIFIGEDADYVSKYLALKETKFNKDYLKCGFPINSLEKYQECFKLHGWQVLIVEDYNPLKELKKVDISHIKIKDARRLLNKLKEYYEKE